ncbi:MAG: quinohemoprotein ethanol dehydrogenase [Gammaproteobacteria bacterium]|jgi:quinohemoprotein ethanol dehydrogenase
MPIRLITALSLILFAVLVMYVALESVPEPGVVTTHATQKPAGIGQVNDARIRNAESEPGNWLAYGRTYEEQRFSPLDQINRETVSGLDLAWYRDMKTTRALEATPIVVDGIMFVSSSWSRVYALNAVSGEEIWSFDPKVPKQWGRRACCDVVNRGVAVYEGKVYVGALDGRLIALDAASGEVVWEVDTFIDRDKFYTITGAPRVARGKVFIGNGGAEFGVRGYLSAYDASSGELAWRFYTVPGDPSKPFEHPEMEMAAETWNGGEWWKIGGGGTVWNSIVYDPEFNHLYFGVGNGSPWPRAIRSPGGGDNLFLSSIVAVDADSGEMQWYYQTTPGDNWDYTAVQDIMLADMKVDGVDRKVLMQAPKNGFFYVIDRTNGELLRAHKFVHTTWATHVDMETGRPVENPDLDYVKDAKWIIPTSLGARNWQGMSFDAKKGIVYMTASEISGIYAMDDNWLKTGSYIHQPLGLNLGVELAGLAKIAAETPGALPSKGYLKAFNPLTGESDWVIEYPHYWNGGALATAGGLVFQGNAEGKVNAMNSDTGAVLWSFQNYTSIIASPVTYQIDGEQYVAILSGTGGGDLFNGYTSEVASVIYGNHGKLLVFKLGGEAKLPVQQAVDRTIQAQPDLQASAEDVEQGEKLFQLNCAACHGFSAKSGGVVRDLRYMQEATHQLFEQIVLKGAFLEKGMPKFDDVLDEEGVRLIHTYVVSRAEADRATQQSKTP